MRREFIFILMVMISMVPALAQLPNDCNDIATICGDSDISMNVSGVGVQELSLGNNACGSENNSLWIKVTTKTGGTLGFTLTPQSSSIEEDYDFYVFGPNVSCNSLGQAIRCSTTNPQAAGQSNNLTGMNASEVDTSEGPGEDGNSFVEWLTTKANETYYIVIDRPHGNSAFNLKWTGSAKFYDAPKNELPIGLSIDIESCDYDNNGTATFDLTTNQDEITAGQNVTVAYFDNISDAQLNSGAITNTTAYESSERIIYMRLTDKLTGCYSVFDFRVSLKVIELGTLLNLVKCDNEGTVDDDGIATFDLGVQTSNVFSNLGSNDYKVTYHHTQTEAENGSNALPEIYDNVIQKEEIVYIRVESLKDLSCYTTANFKLIVNEIPKLKVGVVLKQCDDDLDGYSYFNLDEVKTLLSDNYENELFTYYQSESGALDKINPISQTSAYQNTSNISPTTIWVRAENENGCYHIGSFNLVVVTTQIPTNYSYSITVCDDYSDGDGFNGISSFDLTGADQAIKALFSNPENIIVSYYRTLKDGLAEQNVIENLTNYRNEGFQWRQTLTVRVESKDYNSCLGLGEHIALTVSPNPNKPVLPESPIVCLGEEPLNLEPENINQNYLYQWQDGEGQILSQSSNVTIEKGGTYTLKIVDSITGCYASYSDVVVLESQESLLTTDDLTITQLNASNNSVIIPTGIEFGLGDYEYSLSPEGPFSKESVISELKGGAYKLYINDLKGCKQHILDFTILDFMKYFTPNGDSINDYWHLLGATSTNNAEVCIFDRFGKLLTTISSESKGWDGFYNGKLMPSADYWFTIKLKDGVEKRGHFSLLRK